MAKAKTTRTKAGRLKVYGAAIGFFDTVVAAPNQAEALRAWGVRQNLFAEGAAHLVDDAAAVKAALAHPGEPLRRAIGSNRSFERDPKLPKSPAGAKSRQAKRPSPDRAALEAAEAELARIEEDRRTEEADLNQTRADLDARIADAREAYASRRRTAKDAVAAAKAAFRRDGGKP